jgi:hypothetical protein
MTDILAHGAVFDGDPSKAALNSAAWLLAVAEAQASDQTIICPAGRCVVAEPICINDVAVAIRAPFRDATTIALVDGVNNHAVSFKNTVGGGLFDITVDGNRANQTAGHCIRGENVERLSVERVRAVNAFHYGLGLQAGLIRDLTVDDFIAEDCGGDGIDIKNKLHTNSGNVLRLVRVRRFGLNLTDQAGIDVRGPTLLSDIIVEEFGDVQSGVRFRHGELTDANGLGGHGSIMRGFRIVGSSKTGTLGVSCVARDVSVSDGYVEHVLRPVQAQAEMFSAVNIRAHDCVEGAYANDPAGDDATFVAMRVTGATRSFRTKRPRTEVAASLAKGCAHSIYADAAGTDMRVTGGRSITPSTAHRGGTLANIAATGLLEV